jgi:phage N-6-adenine-methyltransferase
MNNEWSTPKEIFEHLDDFWGFNLDPCATKQNALCSNYFTKEDDGLNKSWEGHTVFMNPPYDRSIYKWVEKAYLEAERSIVVALLPAKTDTKWFHSFIYGQFDPVFIKGRLKFGGSKTSAPFPSMVVTFRHFKSDKELLEAHLEEERHANKKSL